MRNEKRIAVIIPAYNEAESIGRVINEIPRWVDRVIVCDNASTDKTAQVAADAGAHVVHEPKPGYGGACLRAMEELDTEEIVVFLDGDYSDYPEEMANLVDPIIEGNADVVIGSRVLGDAEPGALTPQQRWGNGLACWLMRLIWGYRYSDLGPFRAIRRATLYRLAMSDRDWGWTVEMQVRAAKQRVRAIEVPVRYRKRIGVSKISGTVSGVLKAGSKILYTITRETFSSESTLPRSTKLYLLTKYPEPGKSKTRLIPALGEEGAAEAHRTLATRQAAALLRLSDIDVEVRYTGTDEASMRSWLGPQFAYSDQGDGDLGERMLRAVREGLKTHESVILIGTDCPDLDEDVLEHAAALLAKNDIVVGPAHDGGYYTIGMKQAHEELFRDIDWGTDTVLEKTKQQIASLNLHAAYLPTLHDIDRPEDVPLIPKRDDSPPKISVIIPTLNEEMNIARTLAAIGARDDVEIIVSDGGSSDNTVAIAEEYGARVVYGSSGRGAQLNRGAAEARGEFLCFVHADTILPKGYTDAILATNDAALGAFRLGIDGPGWVLRIAERIADNRTRRANLPYGDQALFTTTATFERSGGFPEIPVMEDFVWAQRMAKLGPVVLVDARVTTSARRWEHYGPLRLTLLHQALIVGYMLGVSPERLARWRAASN